MDEKQGGAALLWTFVDACLRGRLPVDECNPVFYLAVIAALLLVAVLVLAGSMARRARKP